MGVDAHVIGAGGSQMNSHTESNRKSHLFIVEYRFQGDFMQEEDSDSVVVEAESEEDAIRKVEWDYRYIHAGVRKITPCEDEETDYLVDLCEGAETLHSFVVKAHYPLHGSAKDKAMEIVQKNYPDFAQRLNEQRGREDPFAIIVRPSRWVKDGEKLFEATVIYKPNELSPWYGKSESYYIFTVSAKDPEEANAKAWEKAPSIVCGTPLSVSIKRTSGIAQW